MKLMKSLFLVLLLFGLNLYSQKKAEEKVEEKSNSVEQSISAIDPNQAELQTDEFLYRPNGRRDPFMDLLKGKKDPVKRKEGLAGFTIDEINIEGIVFVRGGFIALVKGPGVGRPYELEVGTQVYDGEVIKIDKNTVIFKRILAVAMGGTKIKLVEKKLNPEETQDQEEVTLNEE